MLSIYCSLLELYIHGLSKCSEQSHEESGVIIPMIQRIPSIREARDLLQVTRQLWNGNGAQLCHWPLPQTPSPPPVVLFHGIPKLCVLSKADLIPSSHR